MKTYVNDTRIEKVSSYNSWAMKLISIVILRPICLNNNVDNQCLLSVLILKYNMMNLKGTDGNKITEEDQIIKRWNYYFVELTKLQSKRGDKCLDEIEQIQ